MAIQVLATRRHTTGDYVRAFVRGVGQTMVTLGLVVLLFVVYELWVTNIYAHAKQVKAHDTLVQAWKAHKDPLKGEERAKLPAGKQIVLPAGIGFANLYIPRLGKDYAYTIVEGTTDADLSRGPGHYTESGVRAARPGRQLRRGRAPGDPWPAVPQRRPARSRATRS